ALRSDDISGLPRAALHLPVTTFSFALAGVALIGLPPSGTFVAKFMLLRAALGSGRYDIAIVILTGSLLAAAYIFPVLRRALCRPEQSSAWDDAKRPSPLMEGSALALALLAALLGLFTAAPAALLDLGFSVVHVGGGAP